MKIIVMQTRDGNAAVLDEQGIFHTIKDDNYIVGQKLDMAETELYAAKASGRFRIAGMSKVAAAVLACVLVGGGVTAYAAPVSTVAISQDYTVEYKLNLFDRVIGVEAYAPEGESLSDELRTELTQGVKGKNISDAIDMTMETMEKLETAQESGQGEVSQGEFRLEITGPGAKEELSEKLEQKVDDRNEERRAVPGQDVDANGDPQKSDDSDTSGGKTAQPQTSPDTKNGDRPDGQQDGEGQKPEQRPGGNSNGNPSGNPDGNPSGDPSGNPDGNPSGDPSGNPDGNPSGNPDGNPSGDPSGNPDGNPNGNPDGNPNGNPSGNPDSNPSGDPNGNPDWNPNGNPDGDPNGNPDWNPNGNPNGKPGGNPDGNAAPPF